MLRKRRLLKRWWLLLWMFNLLVSQHVRGSVKPSGAQIALDGTMSISTIGERGNSDSSRRSDMRRRRENGRKWSEIWE